MKESSPNQFKVLKSMVDLHNDDESNFVPPKWMEELPKVKKKKKSYYKRKASKSKTHLQRIDVRVVWKEWRKTPGT